MSGYGMGRDGARGLAARTRSPGWPPHAVRRRGEAVELSGSVRTSMEASNSLAAFGPAAGGGRWMSGVRWLRKVKPAEECYGRRRTLFTALYPAARDFPVVKARNCPGRPKVRDLANAPSPAIFLPQRFLPASTA